MSLTLLGAGNASGAGGGGGGGGGGPSSAKWRLYIDMAQNSGEIAMATLEFLQGGSAPGGGTYTSNNGTAPHDVAKLFDGNAATYFFHGTARDTWIQGEWGSPVSIDALRITSTDGPDPDRAPCAGRLQYYNGSAWVTYSAFTDLTWASVANEVKTFTAPASSAGKNWLAYIFNSDNNLGPGDACATFKWLDVPAGTDLATGGTAFSYPSGGANPASNAFDGNNATRWNQGASGTRICWLGYTWATAQTPTAIEWWPQSGGFFDYSLGDFDVLKSDDAVNWLFVKEIRGITFANATDFKTATL